MTYAYNNRNQRTKATHADGSYWSYGYDSDGNVTAVGQVTNATTFTANNTAFPGLDTSYTYDDIGNRKTAGANTLALNGTVAYTGNYYVATNGTGNTGGSNLNQYGSQDVPRKLDIFGFADANSTVTVNGNSTTWVEDFWFSQLSFSGNNSTQWAALNITAILGGNTTSVTGNRFLSANPEVYSYDADGNLLSDGRWTYTWDAENRLTQLITSSDAVTAGVTKQKIVFGYDNYGRKVQKKVYGWDGSAWNSTPDVNLLYLYSRWNLLAEIDATGTPVVARSYVWGLSKVGGLLMANLNDGTTVKTVYYGYDGNGNVNTFADTNGDIIGSYDYNAFGEVVSIAGAWASYNPIRFSTQYHENIGTYTGQSLGLYYCGYRYYSPTIGRFINRDLIGEAGGLNIYGICGNDLINFIDSLGLENEWAAQEPQYIAGGKTDASNAGPHSVSGTYLEGLQSQWGGNADGKNPPSGLDLSIQPFFEAMMKTLPVQLNPAVSQSFSAPIGTIGVASVVLESDFEGAVTSCMYANGAKGLMFTGSVTGSVGIGIGSGASSGERTGTLFSSTSCGVCKTTINDFKMTATFEVNAVPGVGASAELPLGEWSAKSGFKATLFKETPTTKLQVGLNVSAYLKASGVASGTYVLTHQPDAKGN